MLIELNALSKDNAQTAAKLRDKCLGCHDCAGPCRMSMELSVLPEILLGSSELHS